MNSTAPTATTVLDLPVKSIIVPDVRKKSFRKDDKDIKKFIDDVNKVGILHPINVRPALDGKYELVCGRRRLWIAKHLGHVTIPAIVKDWPDTATDLVRISENVNRHQMTAKEQILQAQEYLRAWERAGNIDLGKAAGGIARAESATREGGKFTKGTKEKSETKTSSKSPELPPPANDITSVAGAQASKTEPRTASFATHLADQTGKSPRDAERDAKIAKVLTPEDLAKLPENISREDLLKITRIEDPAKRLNVIGVVALGMDVSEAVDGIEEPSQDLAKAENAKLEIKLSDQEWVETYCGQMRACLQDPTFFDIDAAFYRRDRDAKAIYQRDGQTKAIAKARAGKHRNLPFVKFYIRFMFVEHPNQWQRCDDCFGNNADQPRCEKCKGAGYKIPVMPEIPKNFR